MSKSEQLTDEQWAILDPLIAVPNAVTMDAADRGEKTAKSLTAFSGYYEPAHGGRICPIDFRHTKPATGVSKCGSETAH